MPTDENHIYIAELATKLGRTEHTIRQWIRREDFPKKLKPKTEGGRNKLYWTPSQLEGLSKYADKRAGAQGWPTAGEEAQARRRSRRAAAV